MNIHSFRLTYFCAILVFVIVEYLAYTWYSLSYIPYARSVFKIYVTNSPLAELSHCPLFFPFPISRSQNGGERHDWHGVISHTDTWSWVLIPAVYVELCLSDYYFPFAFV